MSELEKILNTFEVVKRHPEWYPNTDAPFKVYDKENYMKAAIITDIFKDTNGHVGIEIRYTDDDTSRCYEISDTITNNNLTVRENPDYFYENQDLRFTYLFMTEGLFTKYKDKVWPERFYDDDDLYLEYIETIDSCHAKYKFFWYDGFDRENEYIVTLTREDINELLVDSLGFMYNLQDAITIMGLWKQPDDNEE